MLTIGTLANIKHILQKNCFDATNEKIISVCTVTKIYKKKKIYYLCLILTPLNSPWICQIKQERDGVHKKKRSWSIHEIKLVDGKNNNPDVHEFDIMLDKLYKWYAINLHERQNFLVQLHKQLMKFDGKKGVERAEFKNIPLIWLNDETLNNENEMGGNIHQKSSSSRKGGGGGGGDNGEDDEGIENIEDEDVSHALTDKEISDLTKLVSECDFAIKDAELFIEQLGKKLSELDRANIQSFLTSEMKILTLMEQVERAIKEASAFEERLDSYDEILSHVKETMEKMGGKNAMIEIANTNNIKLMNELNKVIIQLDVSYAHQQALMDPDLKSENGREAAIAAGKILQNAMNCDIDPALLRLSAVQDQKRRFEKWRAKFSQAVSRHLNNLFIHLGNDMGEHHFQSNDLVLPNRSALHKELSVYTELMHWTKAMDKKAYDGLIKVYTSSLGKIYERDLKYFFNHARQTISQKINLKEDLDTSKTKINASKQLSATVIPYGLLGVNNDLWSNGIDPAEREKFDAILEKVLTELEPVALEEQLFCVNFFQLDIISPSSSSSSTTAATAALKTINNEQNNEKDLTEKIETDITGSFSQKKIDRQINEEVRKMMMALFGVLEYELIAFIENFERLDNFYTMYILVRLTQHVMSAQDTHSFLSMTFASALVHVKRNFDKYMQQQLQSIKESKVPKRSKCGILQYVENFEEFAITSENIFKKSVRRADIDKWYIQIVNTIFEYILIHSNEHPKTPSQVIKMENYHHMYAILSQLKIPVLETLKKESKIRYNDALKAYVIKYFGRPLEKLNQFFEGVQQKVSQGVKETEISYQMAYSKQELRKVIALYPAKEVKKGLENLYKKVEKHLCDEENLLQVVWHAMQEEFIAQYNFLEERIQKCYAGAMINLDFTIHDILQFFSDIAISH